MHISSDTKIAGVIGDPISHSLSPRLHNYLLEKHQINGLYLPFKIAKEDLGICLKSFAKLGLKGCNVTIPHKEAAYGLCHQLSPEAVLIGAVNTIIIKDQKLYGHNSDGTGFVNNIKFQYPKFNFKNKKVLILGAGGAARAICFALGEQKTGRITIANRNLERAKSIINDFKNIDQFKDLPLQAIEWAKREEFLSDCDILINCTALGMKDQEELEIKLDLLNKDALVCDIVYKPLMTKLLLNAQNQGNKIVTGIGMLIEQALIGFEAWYEVKPEIDQKLIDLMTELSQSN
jgi:shikimate dehydrogenase